MTVTRAHKYYYSAPDRREFCFDRAEDPDEQRSRAGLSFCQAEVAGLRDGLIDHLRGQGYTEPLDDSGWRLYDLPPQPAGPDPDEGLLVQDAPWSHELQRISGYTD